MFLSKRNGVWYLWYVDDTNRKKKISTHTHKKADAIRFMQSFAPSYNSPTTLSQFISQLLSLRSGDFSPGTLGIYRKSFDKLIAAIGDLPLAKLGPIHYDRFISERGKVISPTTLNIELRTIKAGLKMAAKWKIVSRSPFEGMKSNKVPDKQVRYFSREELRKLVDTISQSWLKDVVMFAALTGMRRSEILSLRWEQVDLGRRVLHIENSDEFRTKTRKRRSIPLSSIVLSLLVRRKQEISEYVFSKDGERISPHLVSRWTRRYIDKLGFSGDLHFHSIRVSVGSYLAEQGISIYHISRLLGHTNVRTTEAFYAHVQPAALSEAVEQLDIDIPPTP